MRELLEREHQNQEHRAKLRKLGEEPRGLLLLPGDFSRSFCVFTKPHPQLVLFWEVQDGWGLRNIWVWMATGAPGLPHRPLLFTDHVTLVVCIGATNTQQGTGRERPNPSAPCTNEANS